MQPDAPQTGRSDERAAPSGAPIGVTGATGFVGRHLVAELLDRGYAVRALARDLAKARAALPLNRSGVGPGKLEIVLGDVFNGAAMRALTSGAFAVAHLIGIRREKRGGVTFQRLHIDATAAALGAAAEARCARFLHMSALGVGPLCKTEYQRSKYQGELLVRAGGVPWTIFRPSIIHGADGEFVQMVKAWGMRRAAPFVMLPYFERMVDTGAGPLMPVRFETPKAQPVYVGDVAKAFAEALARPDTAGEVFALGGPEALAWPDILTTLRDSIPGTSASVGPIGLPADAGVMMAKAAAAVGLAEALPFGPSEPVMASEDCVCSNAKAAERLGFAPRGLREMAGAYGASV